MTQKNNNTGAIIGGAIAFILISIGGYLYFKKPTAQKEETPPEPIVPSVQSAGVKTPPTLPSTNPAGTTPTNASAKPLNVYSTANDAIVYKGIMSNGIVNTIGDKVRGVNKGEKIGTFMGYRDIQNYTYVLVKDIHSGMPVFIAKSVSKNDF